MLSTTLTGSYSVAWGWWVRDHFIQPDIKKSMDPDGMHPKGLRELLDIFARSFSIIFNCHSRQEG